MRMLLQAVRLAILDCAKERLMTVCAVLGMAAVLAPLLILYGVKFGVVRALTDRLAGDPATMEIIPAGSGSYTAEYVAKLAAHPDVAFALPATRATTSATINLSLPDGSRFLDGVDMAPTAAGDPLLLRRGAPIPRLVTEREADGREMIRICEAVLSARAAEKLDVTAGADLIGSVGRAIAGARQDARVRLKVVAVLPWADTGRTVVYLPLPILEAAENYRDGRTSAGMPTEDGWTGDPPPPPAERRYASFRLYARSLEAVAPLRDAFARAHVDVHTQADRIEWVMNLSSSLDIMFSLICLAAVAGFAASSSSAAMADVKRKERTLGLLRLMGMPTAALLLFPLTRALLTAAAGSGLASLLYLGVARLIDAHFAGQIQDAERICALLPEHFAAAAGSAALISLLAALIPAWKAAHVEPSDVIRGI